MTTREFSKRTPSGYPKMRERKLSLKYWHRYLEHVINIYMFLKASIYLVIECYYVRLKSEQPDDSNFEAHQQSVLEYRLFMHRYGLAFRELSTTTVFGCAAHASIIAIFELVNLFARDRVVKLYRANYVILSHYDATKAGENVQHQFDINIKKVMQSNRLAVGFLRQFFSPCLSPRDKFRLVDDLNRQHDRLRRSLADRSQIWPPKSGVQWRQHQTQLALHLYYLMALFLFLGSTAALIFGQRTGYQLLKDSGQVPLNSLERLSFAELFVGVIATGDPFISAVLVLVTIFYDRTAQLRSVRDRLASLNKLLLELRVKKQQPKPIETIHSGPDNEAMDIYICLRVFIAEMEPIIKLANMIMNQCLISVLMVLGPTLLFYAGVDSAQTNILSLIIIYYIAAINSALTIGAAFEAANKKTVGLIWSFLANACPVAAGQEGLELCVLPSNETSLTLNKSELAAFRGDSAIINPHTISLWRQLINKQRCIQSRTNCKILYMIQLNYQNLLRLNFWLISVVLTVLTVRR